ncbi:exopolysaccharide biosynthesis protein [Pasteurellaceae bacterium Pebbles2]|nr:exopolysaccharide biosynthesis protein [Pasteurellaceae bacterium Pebbles2]
MFKRLRNLINKPFRKIINRQNQVRLKNHEFSVISSNCVGALMLHDLNVRFNSPFVNLYLEPTDFIRYLENIEYYQSLNLEFIHSDKSYPVAMLGDVKIHFVHYHSQDEARAKWVERSSRLKLDKLFIVMTDRDGCTEADLRAFDQLPFKHKVVFTHQPQPEIASAVYIQGFEQQNEVGDLFDYEGFFGKKFYDQFDYVGWFNQGK